MSAFNIRRFARPESLHAIAPRHLLAFLKPHRRYLARRGLELPATATRDEIDLDKLVVILADPDGGTPAALIDALHFVNEMSTDEGMDSLLAAADEHSIQLDHRALQSPADVAIQMWMLNPELVQQKHAESFLTQKRSFICYQCRPGKRAKLAWPPRGKVLRALERGFDDWFAGRLRGRGARVLPLSKGDGVWFQIRHGGAFRREGSLCEGEPSSVQYRPLTFDTVVYDPRVGEIRIHADSPRDVPFYRESFGRHVFGDPNFFPGIHKYTLEPLRDGVESLVCIDVPGMKLARLKEVHFYLGGPYGGIEIHKASDVFADFASRDRRFPEELRIMLAAFDITFENLRTARTVIIKPPNVAQHTRKEDSVMIEDWLTKRGFVLQRGESADADSEVALAGS